MKGFTKTQDVRFGGRVDRELLDALIGQQAGDQQDFPAPACPHVLRKQVGDRSQAHHIQLQHRQCRVQRAIHERALESVVGIVYQDVDRNPSLAKPLMQLDDGRNIRKIDLLDDDVDATSLAQLGRQRLQFLDAARHKNKRPTFCCVLPGELFAETTRRARDENRRSVGVIIFTCCFISARLSLARSCLLAG